MGAKKKPQDVLGLGDLGVDPARAGEAGSRTDRAGASALRRRGASPARSRTTAAPPARSSPTSRRSGCCDHAGLPRAPRRRALEGIARRTGQGGLARGGARGGARLRCRGACAKRPAASARRRCTWSTTRRSSRRCRSPAWTRSRRSCDDQGSRPSSSRSRCSHPTSPPALAARLEAGLNWQLTDLVVEGGELVGKQPALGDSVIVDVGWTQAPRLALFRSGAFDPVETGGQADVEPVTASFEDFSLAAAHARAAPGGGERPVDRGGRDHRRRRPRARRAGELHRDRGARRRRSAAPSPRRARSSTRAGTRTRPRSGRRGRPSRRSSTSPAASRARSSTRSGCRRPG